MAQSTSSVKVTRFTPQKRVAVASPLAHRVETLHLIPLCLAIRVFGRHSFRRAEVFGEAASTMRMPSSSSLLAVQSRWTNILFSHSSDLSTQRQSGTASRLN